MAVRQTRPCLVPVIVDTNTGSNAWQNFSRTVGPTLPVASQDMIVVLKFTFGASDKVEARVFSEDVPLNQITEAAFDTGKAVATYAAGIDEFELKYLVINQGRFDNALDEIRIGRSFESVTSVPPVIREPLEITDINRDPDSGEITLTWRSNPGETYGIQWSRDLRTFYPAVHQSIPAHALAALTTFGPFPAPVPDADNLFLRIGPPDTTPPFLFALGGGGNRLVLTWSEPMLPGSATDPANYLVQGPGGAVITVLSADIGDDPNTVILTLDSFIEEGASYTVTVNGVTDPAGLPVETNSWIGFTAWGSPLITEFMASNGSNMYGTEVLLDEDDDSPDWIEIHNPTAEPVNLLGWHLTDNTNNLTKWPIPEIILLPGAHLVLFASGKDRRDPYGELHTNFSLAAEGEYLALVRPAGQGLASEFAPTFPPQVRGISYGLVAGSATEYRYFREPTPWFPNSATGYIGVVDGIEFSVPRGFYNDAFTSRLRFCRCRRSRSSVKPRTSSAAPPASITTASKTAWNKNARPRWNGSTPMAGRKSRSTADSACKGTPPAFSSRNRSASYSRASTAPPAWISPCSWNFQTR